MGSDGWPTLPCLGCRQPFAWVRSTYPEQRVCFECSRWMLEDLAFRLDPTYDPAEDSEPDRLARTLNRLGYRYRETRPGWWE